MPFRLILIVLTLFFYNTCPGQVITTFAGTGRSSSGSLGDGGPATVANISLPGCGSFDSMGNYYFGGSNCRIRKVSTSGIITTVAGNGISGFSGDGGPATNAEIRYAWAISDKYGNIFICDYTNSRLRKVDAATGIIHTIAGNGAGTSTGDGGPATAATITPYAMCIDSYGNIFVNDSTGRIRKIDTSGIISTVLPFTTLSMCFDAQGNLILGQGLRIIKVNLTTHVIDTIAGRGGYMYNGDSIPADSANFRLFDIALDAIGNLYIADYTNERIRMVDTLGIIHTVAGNGIGGYSGDGGPADSAEIYYPEGLTFDACGNMYIADDNNGRIRKVSPLSPIGITVAGVTIGATGDSVTVSATVHNAGYHYTITWLNNGVPFATTTTPSVSYIKTHATDSITAVVYGCSDSAVSAVHVVTDSRVGVGQVAAGGSVSLYPNPGHSEFCISSPERVVSVVVTNLTGEVVYTGASALVNVKPWPPGMYFVKVNGVSVLKFLKE